VATRELFIVPERFGHHVVESSPDQLLAHIEPFSPYEGRYGTMADLPAHLAEKAGARPNIRTAYGERAFCRELSLMEEMGGRRDMLVHFLNGESAVCLTPRAKGENRIVATYHQPAAFMETIIPDKSHFPLHDAVVVVSANQLEYFEKITGKGRVRHIPLGVETGFFPFGAPSRSGRRRAALSACFSWGTGCGISIFWTRSCGGSARPRRTSSACASLRPETTTGWPQAGRG